MFFSSMFVLGAINMCRASEPFSRKHIALSDGLLSCHIRETIFTTRIYRDIRVTPTFIYSAAFQLTIFAFFFLFFELKCTERFITHAVKIRILVAAEICPILAQ